MSEKPKSAKSNKKGVDGGVYLAYKLLLRTWMVAMRVILLWAHFIMQSKPKYNPK